jgi:hypothetical protein
MKNTTYTLNILLADLLTLVLLAMVLVRTFLPRIILPQADMPNLVLISLVVLVLERYLAPGAKRCWICIPVFSFLTFGLLPFAACMVGAVEALLLGVKGCAVFCALTWLYDSVTDRLSSGPAAKAAPTISALGLYLAAQCLMGLFV